MSKQNVNKIIRFCILSLFVLISISSCQNVQEENVIIDKTDKDANEKLFKTTMQTHLDAVTNRDVETLKSTLSPEGKMQLILPNSEIIHTVDGFIKNQAEWFQDTTWTFETKILNTEIGEKMGMAIVEIMYKEPDRNGKPYFNRMAISYTLEKIDSKWYIIKDHASSIERTEN